MGATQPQHSADDAGTEVPAEVPAEGFPEGDPMLDVPEQEDERGRGGQDRDGRGDQPDQDEPDQAGAASPESGRYGTHPTDDPSLTGEDRFDAG